MTASIGTAANVHNGLREYSQVTNSYGGYIKSAGAAYTMVLPFFPDRIDWFNYTKFGTDTNNIQGVWFRDFPAGDGLIVARGTTTLTSTLETTNGFTDATTAGGFPNEHLVITGITTATPAVVTTSTPHGLTTGDRVVITKVIGTMASQVNNNTYVANVLTSTTFGLYDTYGLPITTIGAYSSSGQVTKTGPDYNISDSAPVYQITFGSAIMGASSDVIYFTAWQFNNYVNLGTAS